MTASASAGAKWWKSAVVFQIYPSSYLDTTGNGLGDLPGILFKLDYIASLGVDAVWVSTYCSQCNLVREPDRVTPLYPRPHPADMDAGPVPLSFCDQISPFFQSPNKDYGYG